MQFDFVKHIDINENLIYKISKLKMQHWSYPVEEQINWLKKNIKDEDVHLLLYIENELIGYLLISEINVKSETCIKKYLGIGNVCVSITNRKSHSGYLLMQLANYYYKIQKKSGILLCDDSIVNFYLKCNWLLFNGRKIVNNKEYTNQILTNEKFAGNTIELDKLF